MSNLTPLRVHTDTMWLSHQPTVSKSRHQTLVKSLVNKDKLSPVILPIIRLGELCIKYLRSCLVNLPNRKMASRHDKSEIEGVDVVLDGDVEEAVLCLIVGS